VNPNQLGYWSSVQTINVSLPARVNKFALALGNSLAEIPDGFTNMPVKIFYPGVTDDRNYIESSYDLQISADDFKTTVYSVSNYGHRGILPSGDQVTVNLAAGTTYKARVRSYINGSTNPSQASEWTYTTFTTVTTPAARKATGEEVQGAQTHSQISVAPNPFAESTTLTVASGQEKVQIKVSDMIGRVIEELTSAGGETITLGNGWKKGVYIIQVIDADGGQPVKTIKVIKQ
jgi:hypothetical protein